MADLRAVLEDFGAYSRHLYPAYRLRRYQLEAARLILAGIGAGRGGGYTILFSRQAGKDELLAQLEAFCLARYRLRGGALIVGVPTFKPQALISLRRLQERIETPLHLRAHRADGYRVVCGRAAVGFLSTEPAANVRGETASLALIANEAQDVALSVWDARFAPMTASTNAPAIYSGTPWMAGSLLSRETYLSRQAGRLYVADWHAVAAELPAYGEHVKERIAQLGEQHPFIRSEYCLQELDSAGGLFDERRRVLMHGDHLRQHAGTPGRVYALLLDVGGGDEDASADPAERARERRHDSTALTVVEVDLATVKDPLIRKPAYRVVDRQEWIGEKHSALLLPLITRAREIWRAKYFVVDATGIGAGLASMLSAALSSRCEVLPFIFSQQSKSALGWGFLGTIESGRFKDYADDGAPDTGRYWRQIETCGFSVDSGPEKLMRWAVPDSLGHDDLLISAALVAALDKREWRAPVAVGRTRNDYGESA